MLIGYGVREGREITAGFLNRVRDETGGRVLDLRCCRRGVGQPSGPYYPGRSGLVLSGGAGWDWCLEQRNTLTEDG